MINSKEVLDIRGTTNELRFVFRFEESIKQVFPETYEEGLVYLEA